MTCDEITVWGFDEIRVLHFLFLRGISSITSTQGRYHICSASTSVYCIPVIDCISIYHSVGTNLHCWSQLCIKSNQQELLRQYTPPGFNRFARIAIPTPIILVSMSVPRPLGVTVSSVTSLQTPSYYHSATPAQQTTDHHRELAIV